MMRKVFGCFLFFCALSGYAQTWTERDTGWYQIEYSVITKAEYERLLNQYPEDYGRCMVQYKDRLDSQLPNTIKGYYYLRVRTSNPFGISFPGLACGNSATGRLILVFSDSTSGYEVGTVEYASLYNRYIRRVNGDPAISFPSNFFGTWKRDNFNNTLAFSANTIKSSSQTYSWQLIDISGSSFSIMAGTTIIQSLLQNPSTEEALEVFDSGQANHRGHQDA